MSRWENDNQEISRIQFQTDYDRKTKIQEFKRGTKEWVKKRIPLLPP